MQTCSKENVFWKYAANLQENTHAEVRLELPVLIFNFATKYKILQLKGYGIYSHNLSKSNVSLLSKE